MRRPSRPLLLAALALLAPACAEVGKFAAAAIEKPRLTFRSATVKAIDLEGATLAFTYDLDNPNAFGLDLARVGYGLEVEGKRVVDGDAPGGLRIPASGQAPITFDARLRYRDISGLAALAGKQDAVRYKLSGEVGVRTPLGVLAVPLTHEGSVNLPRLPRFSVHRLSVRSASLSQVSLELELRMENPNDFPLPAGRLDARLTLAGREVAAVGGQPLAALPRGGSGSVVIPVRLDLERAGRVAADVVSGEKVDLSLTGAADVGGLSVPLELSGKYGRH